MGICGRLVSQLFSCGGAVLGTVSPLVNCEKLALQLVTSSGFALFLNSKQQVSRQLKQLQLASSVMQRQLLEQEINCGNHTKCQYQTMMMVTYEVVVFRGNLNLYRSFQC